MSIRNNSIRDKSPSENSKNAPEIDNSVKFEPNCSSNSSKWSSLQVLSELLSDALIETLVQELFMTIGHIVENQSFDGYLYDLPRLWYKIKNVPR